MGHEYFITTVKTQIFLRLIKTKTFYILRATIFYIYKQEKNYWFSFQIISITGNTERLQLMKNAPNLGNTSSQLNLNKQNFSKEL